MVVVEQGNWNSIIETSLGAAIAAINSCIIFPFPSQCSVKSRALFLALIGSNDAALRSAKIAAIRRGRVLI